MWQDLWLGDLSNLEVHYDTVSAIVKHREEQSVCRTRNTKAVMALLNLLLLADVLTEQTPRYEFRDLGFSHETARAADLSPFSGPKTSPSSQVESLRCSPGTFALLEDVREVVSAILEDDANKDPEKLAMELLEDCLQSTRSSLPLVMFAERQRISTVVKYAAILFCTAVSRRKHLSQVVELASSLAGVPNILQTIHDALPYTQPSQFWGFDDMWTVFLFVGLVLLPTTVPQSYAYDCDEFQWTMRSLRAPVLSLIPVLPENLLGPYFQNILTMVRIQRWLADDPT
ncbi:MAG: hypothetical protein Q9162_003486 [Coniocarpon cinnabarinum]